MKTKLFYPICFVLLMCITAGSVFAQLEDAIEQLTSENTKGYLQPFVEAFGSNLNAGIYRTAHVSKMGLHLYIGVMATGAVIPDEAMTFMGTPPLPYPQSLVETASVFGKEGAVVAGPNGLSFAFQDGQIQGDFAPMAVPHLEVGSILGTMIKLRYFVFDFGENIGKMELLGYGLQHSISQYIPLFPLDISLGIFKQSFDVGEIISTSALSYGIQVSRSLPLLTLYTAAGVENTTMDVTYTYQGEGLSQKIELDLKTGNQFRFTIGARLRLAILIINGDYSMSKYNTVTLGIGIGL